MTMERYTHVLDAMFDSVVAIDTSGVLVAMNAAAEDLFGHDRRSALGQRLDTLLIPERLRDRHRTGFRRLIETGESPLLNARHEVQGLRSDGTELPIELTVTRLEDEPLVYMAVLRDLSMDKRHLRQIEELARENEQILTSAGDGIVRYDLEDHITYANPSAAELVGRSVADLMGRPLHETIHHSYADGRHYPENECPVMGALRGGGVCHVTSEVLWRADGTSFPADYTGAPIREHGEIIGGVCVFADITEQRAREDHLRERAEWSERILRGLRDSRFVMHAQPIVDLETRDTQMHELLIRMHTEEGALLGPGGFLPQAERFGLMNDIDHWVVGEAVRIACRQPVTVNLSAQSISDVSFTNWTQRMIEEAGAPPHNLLFEITETAALEDFELASQLVLALTDFGCQFALDDFGTGFGSFTELQHLPVTHLKIDRSFVREMGRNENDTRVVAAIVGVAQSFGMKTIAEGVEETETLDLLSEMGVDYAQGYSLGRPAALVEDDKPLRAPSSTPDGRA